MDGVSSLPPQQRPSIIIPVLRKSGLVARLAAGADDVVRCQRLRACAFGRAVPLDRDPFDAMCDHVMIERMADGALLGCFRLLPLRPGRPLNCYAATSYDLANLQTYPGRMLEIGRFCVAPGAEEPDVLRLAWAAITRFVDARSIDLLFGCSSFVGTDADCYADAFAVLGARHLAPSDRAIGVKAAETVALTGRVLETGLSKRGMAQMPPLLRTYLSMGGWVSDHAVVDRDMDTLHVFTGVEVASIPPARQRLLRALAQ